MTTSPHPVSFWSLRSRRCREVFLLRRFAKQCIFATVLGALSLLHQELGHDLATSFYLPRILCTRHLHEPRHLHTGDHASSSVSLVEQTQLAGAVGWFRFPHALSNLVIHAEGNPAGNSVFQERGRGKQENGKTSPNAFADKESILGQTVPFLMYFGAQTSISCYMKWLLSKVPVTLSLVGVPAAFLVMSVQQVVVFLFVLMVLRVRHKKVKWPTSSAQWRLIWIGAATFSLNTGLNLFSLALIPLSLALIIRACMPLAAAVLQTIVYGRQNISPPEWLCMTFGVICACLVVISNRGWSCGAMASPAFIAGVAASVASVFCGALDMLVKRILGTSKQMSATETIVFEALPVALITATIGLMFSSPVSASWAAHYQPRMTDWEVFKVIWQFKPIVLGFVAFSGLLACWYNLFTTLLIVRLSPATTAFAGNFNHGALVFLSLLFLDRHIPPGYHGVLLIGGVIGNIASFTCYNILKRRGKNS